MIDVPSIPLPRPINRTVNGPEVHKAGGVLVVDYDFETDDGTVEWSRVSFEEPLVFEYRDSACCLVGDIVGSHEIRVQRESALLRATLERWQEAVGWQDWQAAKGGAERFRHFSLWFDDASSLDIVASSCNAHVLTTR